MERNLGNTIRSLRLQADCNQDELARDAGMSASNLSKIENSQYLHPSRARVTRLAEALGRRLGWTTAELERWKRELLRLAGWATDDPPASGDAPLDKTLARIGALSPVEGVGELLRLHGWPPDRVDAVRRAVEIFRPKSPQPEKAA